MRSLRSARHPITKTTQKPANISTPAGLPTAERRRSCRRRPGLGAASAAHGDGAAGGGGQAPVMCPPLPAESKNSNLGRRKAPVKIDSDEEHKKKRSRLVKRQVIRISGSSGGKLPSFYDDLPQNRSSKRLASSKRNKRNQGKLDTNVFESYMEYLWNCIAEDKKNSYTYFDSLWFSMYVDGFGKSKILQRIKDKQIFSRQYVFVPIVCWRHWSLLILCHFGETNCLDTKRPCMLLLDSLKTTGPKRLESGIRRFITDIYETEGREENKHFISKIPLLIPKVPQQTNGEECGIFVLYFIYRFLQKLDEDFSQQFDESWFDLDELENFRKEVRSYQTRKKTENVE